MKKLIISLTVVVICFATTYGQDQVKPEHYRKWEIGVNGGVAIFTGEFNMSKDVLFKHYSQWNSQFKDDYGLFLRKNFNQVFALEVAWNHSNITGSWKYNDWIIPDFRTQLIESDLNSVWNLTNLFSSNKFDRKIYWYGKFIK